MKSSEKYIRMAYYALIAILLIIGMVKIFSSTSEEIDADNSIVNLLVNQGAYYAIGAMIIAVVVSLIGIATNIRRSLWSIIGVAALLVIFGIAWSMSGAGTPDFLDTMEVSAFESRMSEAGLKTMVILGALGIIGAIVSGLKGLFE